MRRILELLVLLVACGLTCWLLHSWTVSRPTVISGTVVDWITGQPAPQVEVRFSEPNGGSEFLARTDVRGRFSGILPEDNWSHLLYPEDARFGRLLQSTFGYTVSLYKRGQQVTNVIVPGIPATELSGRVYDEAGMPIPGCEVWVLIEDADHPGELGEVDMRHTGQDGGFRFTSLGADRFFLLARCRKYLTSEQPGPYGVGSMPNPVHISWQSTLFPNATSLDGAKAITLLPGDRRSDIEFHLATVPEYGLSGTVTFSDGSRPRPWPEVIYTHDFTANALDEKIAPLELGGETCDWNANTGNFQCEFLPPGVYRLRFMLEGAIGAGNDLPRQGAEITYQVPANRQQQHKLNVRLHELPDQLPASSENSQTGSLNVRRVCPPEMKEGWPVHTIAWGPVQRDLSSRRHTCSGEETWALPAGTYNVATFRQDFSGPKSRIPFLLQNTEVR